MKPIFSLNQALYLIETTDEIKSLERLLYLIKTDRYNSSERLVLSIEINDKIDKLIK